MQEKQEPQPRRLRRQQPRNSGERVASSQGTITVGVQSEEAPTQRTNVWRRPLQEGWRDAQTAKAVPKGGEFEV